MFAFLAALRIHRAAIPRQAVWLLVPCAFDSCMSFAIIYFVVASLIASVFEF